MSEFLSDRCSKKKTNKPQIRPTEDVAMAVGKAEYRTWDTVELLLALKVL